MTFIFLSLTTKHHDLSQLNCCQLNWYCAAIGAYFQEIGLRFSHQLNISQLNNPKLNLLGGRYGLKAQTKAKTQTILPT